MQLYIGATDGEKAGEETCPSEGKERVAGRAVRSGSEWCVIDFLYAKNCCNVVMESREMK